MNIGESALKYVEIIEIQKVNPVDLIQPSDDSHLLLKSNRPHEDYSLYNAEQSKSEAKSTPVSKKSGKERQVQSTMSEKTTFKS